MMSRGAEGLLFHCHHINGVLKNVSICKLSVFKWAFLCAMPTLLNLPAIGEPCMLDLSLHHAGHAVPVATSCRPCCTCRCTMRTMLYLSLHHADHAVPVAAPCRPCCTCRCTMPTMLYLSLHYADHAVEAAVVQSTSPVSVRCQKQQIANRYKVQENAKPKFSSSCSFQ